MKLLPQNDDDRFGLALLIAAVIFVGVVLWSTHGFALHCLPTVPP